MNFIITFIILSIVNVVFSTIRSIATIKSGKTAAALISGGYFAFYNVVLLYTVADFPMWQKCLITFCCNVIGVWVVKFGEEKLRKDKLWKVEVTIPKSEFEPVRDMANSFDLSYNYVDIGKWYLFNFYCPTQKESQSVKEILKKHSAKYFVSESKIL
jgi:uncharacterized protein YebE (UPF0316 family)